MASLTPGQRRIVQRIVQVGRQVGATPKEIKAALETGRVESNFSNPQHATDHDSIGWRQERASLYPNPGNLDASIRRFFQETKAVKGKYGNSGDLAAAVQRPAAQYRGRYAQVSGEAQRLLEQAFSGRIPSGGGSSSGRTSASGGSSTTRTVTTTTPGVDNRVARASLIQSFLDSHSSIDPLDFAVQARQLQDVAPTSTTRTTRSSTPGAAVRAAGHGSISPQGAGSSFAKSHSPLLELIHKTSSGPGYAVKNGKVVNGPQVFSSVWDGHADHVHVAAGPKTVVEIGRMAQKMGLHVGENPHFGGVNPVHAPGSYHYRGEAIDVSGDPGRMNHFAAEVKRLYGLR
jgi:hypothetical protein